MTGQVGNNSEDMFEVLRNSYGVAFATSGEIMFAFASHNSVNGGDVLDVSQYMISLADAKSLRAQLDIMIENVQARRAASRRGDG